MNNISFFHKIPTHMRQPAVNRGVCVFAQAIFFQVLCFIPVCLDTVALIVYTLFTILGMGDHHCVIDPSDYHY